MNLIERISQAEGVVDFKTTPDEFQLHIYELALKEVWTVLLKENLLDLPKGILLEFLEPTSLIPQCSTASWHPASPRLFRTGNITSLQYRLAARISPPISPSS